MDVFNKKYYVPLNDNAILLVEDNLSCQLLVEEALSEIGVAIISQTTGKGALEAYNVYKDKIRLILLDINLSDISGFEVASEIRSENIEIPILFVSANDFGTYREKIADAGGNGFLNKPYELKNLIATVKKYVRGKKNTPNCVKPKEGIFSLDLE